MKDTPLALLIYPPVYDFALYDLYFRPYPLLRLGKWLTDSGFRTKLVNYLNYTDPVSGSILGIPRRKPDGTGKFFKAVIDKPEILADIPRNYHRYGITSESAENRLKFEKPDIILISSGMTYWYPGVKETVQTVRKLFPGVPVIIGGTYATLCKEHCCNKIGPDYVITGNAYPEISSVLAKLKLPYSEVPINEEILILKEELKDSAVLRINTGCPFTCDYCASNKLTGKFVQGDPELAFNTVYQIHKTAGTVNFAFLDDALLFRKKKGIEPFLEKIIASGLKLNFFTPNAVHLEYIDRETAQLMKQAGFRELRIGFESSSQDFHSEKDKKLAVENLGGCVKILKSAGFASNEICAYILAGLPGQYAEEVEDSIKFASEYKIKIILAQYSPVPYTELWNKSVMLSGYPVETEPLTHNNTLFPMEWEHFKLEDLKRLRKLSHELSG